MLISPAGDFNQTFDTYDEYFRSKGYHFSVRDYGTISELVPQIDGDKVRVKKLHMQSSRENEEGIVAPRDPAAKQSPREITEGYFQQLLGSLFDRSHVLVDVTSSIHIENPRYLEHLSPEDMARALGQVQRP